MSTIENYIKKYDKVFEVSPSLKAIELSRKYGFLDYMVERYLHIFRHEAEDFLYSCNFPLKKSIRCNTLKIDCNELESRMEQKGFKLEKVSWLKHGYIVKKAPPKPSLGATLEYLQGYYYIQGLASMVPAYVLNPSSSDTVLDMAAAPGGKTTQLSQIMNNEGLIVAVEKSRLRVTSLLSNISRLGVRNVLLLRSDVRTLEKTTLSFDKILLDAPCSGEGLIPEDQSRKTKTSLDELKRFSFTQLQLIYTAYKLLKKGGELVYSTCSIAPEEDEMIVNFAIEELGMKVIKISGYPAENGIVEYNGVSFNEEVSNCIRFYPHKNGTEGFFICHLKKC
jgi:NOL1/NOP2/sun family putative RNA methylase